jgi:hypothetical protein
MPSFLAFRFFLPLSHIPSKLIVRYIAMSRSWPQLAKISGLILFQLTSSTPVLWKWYSLKGFNFESLSPLYIFQMHIFLSNEPEINKLEFI